MSNVFPLLWRKIPSHHFVSSISDMGFQWITGQRVPLLPRVLRNYLVTTNVWPSSRALSDEAINPYLDPARHFPFRFPPFVRRENPRAATWCPPLFSPDAWPRRPHGSLSTSGSFPFTSLLAHWYSEISQVGRTPNMSGLVQLVSPDVRQSMDAFRRWQDSDLVNECPTLSPAFFHI